MLLYWGGLLLYIIAPAAFAAPAYATLTADWQSPREMIGILPVRSAGKSDWFCVSCRENDG